MNSASHPRPHPPSSPRPGRRLAYAASQAARVAWFFGQYALAARLGGPVRVARSGTGPVPGTRGVLDSLRALMARDLANIEAGYYRMPHDLLPAPGRVLAEAAAFFRDLPEVARRREDRVGVEVRDKPPPGTEKLPAYYRQNFHFQTDGYLSERSARLYDHQVEVLFGGGADAMRRQCLVPIFEYVRDRRVAECRLLDVAAGTGRFLTFVKDNHPRLPVTALDLSTAYLKEARRALAPWARTSSVVQGAAEAMPVADGSQDIVTCIYLFHELPPKLRGEVAREFARVLKPGGVLVFMDSLQKGDDPALDGLLDLFPQAFHEPYYAHYARDDLAAHFAGAGLEPIGVELAFMSKLAVWRKPQPMGEASRDCHKTVT
ncbi:class I SAM-dependent methyltransferase [Azospirillum sp. SYSU D00513]|uniref:class I SAM-dependent methyltransferase n=1 Tax=Azospirillum sp. SYSU D00513 TaxID=2812561 RepID=UPI001A968B60|nr:class I SAM-dependent methyltransferase [Azospirillum sp. SYSU D00513]